MWWYAPVLTSILVIKAGGSGVKGHCWLHRKFEASLSYLGSYFKKEREKEKKVRVECFNLKDLEGLKNIA